ncbi:hypothetical protein EUBIFOR_02179 [Holdemanella biformis DSM 3989]|uniref:Uncharacterized protein n=1 Tax=Holdemanella biformis DSM 3989 TaxID=518637 RepID=B7CD98_9FIRM|nr:hypothetical protein EUBIFOR_02179 [Holdemanella biformis DSM 3989]
MTFDLFFKMEKKMPRQREASPTIYSGLVKWNLTFQYLKYGRLFKNKTIFFYILRYWFQRI